MHFLEWISTNISLKFVPMGPINHIPALVQIMAWRRPGDKPLSEPMTISLPTHICVTRPQWFNALWPGDYRYSANVTLHATSDGLVFLQVKHKYYSTAPSTTFMYSGWRHQMKTFSVLLALFEGNPPVNGEFPSQRPVTRSFDVFFGLCLNKRLSKQSICRWFETPSRSL